MENTGSKLQTDQMHGGSVANNMANNSGAGVTHQHMGSSGGGGQQPPMYSAPHINADILNQIRGAQQPKSGGEGGMGNMHGHHNMQHMTNANAANYNKHGGISNISGVPTSGNSSFPDDIQAAMAKQHHTLLDGSFMPDTAAAAASHSSLNQMNQADSANNMLRNKANISAVSV